MKVLLVSHSFEQNSRDLYAPNTGYSIGLAYLASYLEREGHEVEVLWRDCCSFPEAQAEILARINDWQPQILGIQMFTMNRVASYRLIEECALRHPGVKIVAGGIHASALPDQIVTQYKNVTVVIGEGELTIGELAAALEKGRPDIHDINGIAFWENGKVVKTAPRELIEDLDSLPHPKHEVYFEKEPLRTVAHIVTTRGCPFMCSFCCLHIISRRRHRKRSVDNVVQEIVSLKAKYPRLASIQIHDDIFTLDSARVIQFCKKMIDLNLGIRFACSAKVKPMTEEMLVWMHKAGFDKFMFGLETGSERVLELTHKGVKKGDVLELFKKLSKYDFLVTTFLILGLPGETEETVDETIAFVQKLQKIHYSYIYGIGILWVYPETEVYQMMKAKGLISDDYWLTDGDVLFFTGEHDLETLKKFQNKMLDHLSVTRILTWRGFLNHFCRMPLVIIRFLRLRRDVARAFIGHAIYNLSPALYARLYKIIKKV